METYEIAGRAYPVSGYVHVEQLGRAVPLLDIRMMSDERWEELARESTVRNYTEAFGYAPESVAVALAWQRGRAAV